MTQSPEPAFTQFQSPQDADVWQQNSAQALGEMMAAQSQPASLKKKGGSTAPAFGVNPSAGVDKKGRPTIQINVPCAPRTFDAWKVHPDNPERFKGLAIETGKSIVQHPLVAGRIILTYVGLGLGSLLVIWAIFFTYFLNRANSSSPASNSNAPAFQSLPTINNQ